MVSGCEAHCCLEFHNPEVLDSMEVFQIASHQIHIVDQRRRCDPHVICSNKVSRIGEIAVDVAVGPRYLTVPLENVEWFA